MQFVELHKLQVALHNNFKMLHAQYANYRPKPKTEPNPKTGPNPSRSQIPNCTVQLANCAAPQIVNNITITNCSSSRAHALNVTEAIDYMSLITVHCALMTLTSVTSRLNPRSDCMSTTLATACPHTNPRQCIHRHGHTGTQRDIHLPCSSPCTQTHA